MILTICYSEYPLSCTACFRVGYLACPWKLQASSAHCAKLVSGFSPTLRCHTILMFHLFPKQVSVHLCVLSLYVCSFFLETHLFILLYYRFGLFCPFPLKDMLLPSLFARLLALVYLQCSVFQSSYLVETSLLPTICIITPDVLGPSLKMSLPRVTVRGSYFPLHPLLSVVVLNWPGIL